MPIKQLKILSPKCSGNIHQPFGNVALRRFMLLWFFRRPHNHSWNAVNMKYTDNNCTYLTDRISTIIQHWVLEFHSAVDF